MVSLFGNSIIGFVFIFLLVTKVSAKSDRQYHMTLPKNWHCYSDAKKRVVNIDNKPTNTKYCESQIHRGFASENCFGKVDCEALKPRLLSRRDQNLPSEVGNAAFHKCRIFAGTPMVVELWNGKNWRSTSICEFKDESYVGLDYWASMVVRTPRRGLRQIR